MGSRIRRANGENSRASDRVEKIPVILRHEEPLSDPKQPLPFICLASQKNYMSLYLGSAYGPEREAPFREAWAKTGRKLDMGKSCVRFRKLEDLALDVIGESIHRVSASGFIEYYESTVQGAMESARARKKK